ncbi:carboxypeptidase regulatory-like domain-containing protein, partial [candidate division WOR-3 bacterium]|nr:carboxypeptidase regulatory-like domain-containing protein [candidate division WOR-3 bacterium]
MLGLLVMLLAASGFAYPGFGGGRGLLRVNNAQVEPEAGLTFSLHGLARSADFPSADTPATRGWVADLIAPELSYAPVVTKYMGLELYGSWGGIFQVPASAESEDYAYSTHDLKAGGKLSVPILPVLKLGTTASYAFQSRRQKEGWTVLDPAALPLATGLTWNWLATWHLQDIHAAAPNVLLSYGKSRNRRSPEDNETRYGVGLELQERGFGLFVEALSQQPDDRSGGMFDTRYGHLHITPGLAVGTSSSALLKLGYTFSVGGDALDAKPPNEFILGLGLTTPFGRRPPRQYGQVVGVVTDVNTGLPVVATIAFPDMPEMAALLADANTGTFKVDKAPAGAVMIEVGAAGYVKQTVPLAVEANKAVAREFRLRPLKAYGAIAGTVVDAATGAPMAARIEFPGSTLDPTQADPDAGAFKVEKVQTGVYTVTAGAENYLKSTIPLAVEENKLAVASFRLLRGGPASPAAPAETAVVVSGKVYDKATGGPLPATVTVSQVGTVAFVTDTMTGLYMAQLLPGAYSLAAEAA